MVLIFQLAYSVCAPLKILVNCAVNDTLSIYLQDTSASADMYGGSNSHNGFMVKFLG